MSIVWNLFWDILIFIAFLVVANPKVTGNTLHEWLGIAFFAAIVAHLLFHWKWLVSVIKTFFKKLLHKSKLNFVIDVLFFIAFTCSIFSGFMISKNVLSTFGIHLSNISREWKSIHTLSSDASIILLGIHFGLHWRWIVNTIRKYVFLPILSLFKRNNNDTRTVTSTESIDLSPEGGKQ